MHKNKRKAPAKAPGHNKTIKSPDKSMMAKSVAINRLDKSVSFEIEDKKDRTQIIHLEPTPPKKGKRVASPDEKGKKGEEAKDEDKQKKPPPKKLEVI